ncbi:MAG: N-acyl homoserine lactonase family protein, partial [Vulcanimicrobiaceae bacterium]
GNMYMDARRLIQRKEYYQRLSAPAPQDLWKPIPVLTALLVHPEGNLLFDLGATSQWETRWKATGHADVVPYLELTDEQKFENLIPRVKELDDVDWIVVSHLHMDHCGNLRFFAGKKATVLVQEAEYKYAVETVKPPGLAGYVTSEYGDDVRWRLVAGDLHGLMSGVDVVDLQGHTFGAQGLIVRLRESGTVLLASDACYTLDSMGPPPIPGATVHDHPAWLRSIERIRLIRKAEKALVIAGHDMEQIATLRLGPDRYYD